MFKNLVNEAKLSFTLKTDSPLCIKSGNENGLDPTLPDMQCIRTSKDGVPVVFIPGSSIKGVVRTRCEKIINLLGGDACNVVEIGCSKKFESEKKQNADMYVQNKGKKVYDFMCHACRMFGSTSIGARVKFKDAFPIGKPVLGFRTGVGINRITGAAQRGALYDFEVVEEGSFKADITLTNYELYQLKLLMFALKDIHEGYSAFGGASTRGNGKMLIPKIELELRDYRREQPQKITGYNIEDIGKELEYKKELYYYLASAEGLDSILELLTEVDVEKSLTLRS